MLRVNHSAATILGAVAVLATAITLSSKSASGSSNANSSPPPRATVNFHLQSDHTTSRDWVYIDLPSHPPTPSDGFNLRSKGLVTLSLNAVFHGAPIQLRLVSGNKVVSPRILKFNPSRGANSFSYTFTDKGAKATCGHTFRLEWRSRSGHQISLHTGGLVATYIPASGDANVCP